MTDRIIDLRSDTVTLPTEKMRDVMRNAPVGDDVLGEDPTVRKLEAMAAERFGREKALFVTSGTMANQVTVMTLCRRGDQIIVHRNSHIYNLEVGGLASTCGVQPRAVHAPGGVFNLEELNREIHAPDIQRAPTTLICLENSFDLNRGLAVPREHIEEVCSLAGRGSVNTYMDGARVFNAAIALGTTVESLTKGVDVVATCLSKGLGCPVGSLIMGEAPFVDEARRMRQRVGGGWRQAGILAAAGVLALEEMVDRLAEDHERARVLAHGLISLGLGVDPEQVQTNIVHVDLSHLNLDATGLAGALAQSEVRIKPVGPMAFRMVTHKDILDEDIPVVIDRVKSCLEKSDV
jgi:threonine aldolase